MQLSLVAASVNNETNQALLADNIHALMTDRFGFIADSAKHRKANVDNKALEIMNEGTGHSTLKVMVGKYEGELSLQDSYFKADAPAHGIEAMGAPVPKFGNMITLLERIVPQLGVYFAFSQAQIALLRFGWGAEDLKANDKMLKDWISDVASKLLPTRRMPVETTILYFIQATLKDGSMVNGMWPNTLSAELFYNLESGHIEKYVSEHEHYLELKDGRNFTLVDIADGGVGVRAVSENIADSHPILHFYNDVESSDKGLLLAAVERSISLLGKTNNKVSHFKAAHLRSPKGKEFRFVMWGSNNFDVYIVEEGQGGVRTL